MLSADIHILVVDDTRAIRTYVKGLLRSMGCPNFLEAINGNQAFDLLVAQYEKGAPFDLILSDWNMPVMSGLELLSLIRSDPRFENIPFMMITAEKELPQIHDAIKLRVTDYVVKPFTAEVFHSKIKSILEKYFRT